MLGCATGVELRLFHFIRHFKRSFYSVLHLFPIYCFWKPNRAFGGALHQRDLPYYGRAPGATSVLNSA